MTTITPAVVNELIGARCEGADVVRAWIDENVHDRVEAGKIAAGCCAPLTIFGRSLANAARALHGLPDAQFMFAPNLEFVGDDPVKMRVEQIDVAARNGDAATALALVATAAMLDDRTIYEIAAQLVDRAHFASHQIGRI